MRIQKVLTRIRKSSYATSFMKDILEAKDYNEFIEIASKYVIIKHIDISNNNSFGNSASDSNFRSNEDDDDGDIIK